jgi:hypothetical protein
MFCQLLSIFHCGLQRQASFTPEEDARIKQRVLVWGDKGDRSELLDELAQEFGRTWRFMQGRIRFLKLNKSQQM